MPIELSEIYETLYDSKKNKLKKQLIGYDNSVTKKLMRKTELESLATSQRICVLGDSNTEIKKELLLEIGARKPTHYCIEEQIKEGETSRLTAIMFYYINAA